MSVKDGPGEGTWSVFALKVVEERDALREEVEQLRASHATLILLVDRLAADRRQLYTRLRDNMPWVGYCPFNPSQAREMFLSRDLASDTLKEVSLDLDRAEIVAAVAAPVTERDIARLEATKAKSDLADADLILEERERQLTAALQMLDEVNKNLASSNIVNIYPLVEEEKHE